MKNALFLGGSKGLGLALAKRAFEEGWQIMIASRTRGEMGLHDDEGRVRAITVDLESQHPLEGLASDFASTHPPFDVIVWTAGAYQEGSILDLDPSEVERIYRNHQIGPIVLLNQFLRRNRETGVPCHLIVIASSSSYRVRKGEGLYGVNKAGKAQLARTYAAEIAESIPGSKVLLINPGGMNTPFWKGRGRDVSGFMDPAEVANLTWAAMEMHAVSDEFFDEAQIDRQPDGSGRLVFEKRPPQF